MVEAVMAAITAAVLAPSPLTAAITGHRSIATGALLIDVIIALIAIIAVTAVWLIDVLVHIRNG